MARESWWQRSLNSHFHSMRTKSPHDLESKQRIEGSMKLQKDHVIQHSERNSEIVIVTTRRVDSVERRRVAKDLAWKAKWGKRTAKLNRRAKRYR